MVPLPIAWRWRGIRATSCRRRLAAVGHLRFEVPDDRLEELLGRHPRLLGADEDREVLGHVAGLDRLDAYAFQRLGEAHHIWRVVELAAKLETAGPGEDRGNRVGRRRLALLMHSIVAGHPAPGRPALGGLALGGPPHPGAFGQT